VAPALSRPYAESVRTRVVAHARLSHGTVARVCALCVACSFRADPWLTAIDVEFAPFAEIAGPTTDGRSEEEHEHGGARGHAAIMVADDEV
jgi:hypothetical protein